MVNEPENAVLRKLRKLEKWWRLAPRSEEGGAWRDQTTARRFLLCEKYKTLRTYLVWRLAAKWVPLGGSCCSRNPEIPLAPTNLNHSPLPSFHSIYDSKGCTHMFRFTIHS